MCLYNVIEFSSVSVILHVFFFIFSLEGYKFIIVRHYFVLPSLNTDSNYLFKYPAFLEVGRKMEIFRRGCEMKSLIPALIY